MTHQATRVKLVHMRRHRSTLAFGGLALVYVLAGCSGHANLSEVGGDACLGSDCSDGAPQACDDGTCGSGLHCEAGSCVCDPTSCSGCCSAGACVDGTSADTCGSGGNACTVCPAGEACNAGGYCGIGRLVLFGGSNGNTKLNDTWSFDGTSWTQLPVTGGPIGGNGVMASLAHKVVWFSAGETWIFDGAAWTQVAGTGPGVRSQPSMSSLGDKVVLFGGTTNGGGTPNLKDTWTFDGTTWTQSAAMGPPQTTTGAMAPLGADLILHGGKGAGNFSQGDTWKFDGTTWTKLADGADAFFPCASTLGNKFVMYRGANNAAAPNTTWTFDGTAWTKLNATLDPTRSRESMATLGDKIVLFGGFGTGTTYGDTWTFDGTAWTKLNIPGPSARGGQGMGWMP